MRAALRLMEILSVVLTGSLSCFAQQHTVALTFDDLPAVGTTNPTEAKTINHAILQSLERHKVPATGFVVEKGVQSVGEIDGKEILWQWVQHGYDLGNHSYSHPDFNELTIEQMEQEVVLGEKTISEVLRKVGKVPRYFRFPMNHTGETAAKHDAIASFLTNRGYKLAACTIDNEDFVFDSAYLLILAKKDEVLTKRLRAAYLAYTSAEIDYYSDLNKQVVGYELPHVMILHANRLNRDTIDGVRDLFEQRHFRFVSLDEAQADPAFNIPDTFITSFGPMWGYRWAAQRHVKVNGNLETEPPAWVVEYTKK